MRFRLFTSEAGPSSHRTDHLETRKEPVIHHARSCSRPRRARVQALLLFVAFAATSFVVPANAQAPAKKILTVNDYGRWRSIEGAQISGDGNWVTYGLRFTNVPSVDAKPVLHILRLDTNQDVQIANASNGTFSSDSRWIVYQVDSAPGGGRGGRGGRGGGAGGAPGGGTPAPGAVDTTTVTAPGGTGGRGAGTPPAPARRFELRELATGKTQVWADMSTATFAPTASHLVLKRRVPGGTGDAGGRGAGGGGTGGAPGAPAATPGGPTGADVVLVDLASGRSQLLGSVGDIAFNKRGDLLAYTVDAAQRDGNGLFLIDLQSGRTDVLDNDARAYSRLTWNEDGSGVAVLKG